MSTNSIILYLLIRMDQNSLKSIKKGVDVPLEVRMMAIVGMGTQKNEGWLLLPQARKPKE